MRNVLNSTSAVEFTGVNPEGYGRYASGNISISKINKLTVRRVNGKIYYRINEGPYIYTEHDTTSSTAPRFDTPVTFGGSLSAVLDTITGTYNYTPFRIINGTLSNMIIKEGTITENDLITVTLSGNGGTSITASYKENEELGNIVTSRDGYIFTGWYTKASGGTLVPANTIITEEITYYAHWVKSAKSLTFQQNQFTLNVGETAQIIPTNASSIGEEWTYSSGKSQIVTVDQTGLITAKNVGKTYIRVRGKTSGQYKDINVTVSGSVSDITYYNNPINIVLGNTYDAHANISNLSSILETFTFTSSDDNFFTVDSSTGIITPIKTGYNKVLTIKGDTSELTNDIKVNIGNPGSVAEIQVQSNPIPIVLGNTFDAKSILTNLENVTETYSFSSSSTSIFTVNSSTGVITPIKASQDGILRIKGNTSKITMEIKVSITNS